MNTIVLNILSKNNLLVEREQFQLEFIESLFQNLISQEEIDESIKVSSIFGTFFNENISLVEGETYKISVTIKKEQIFGIAVQSLFRKALIVVSFFSIPNSCITSRANCLESSLSIIKNILGNPIR